MPDPTDDFNESEARWVQAFRIYREIDKFLEALVAMTVSSEEVG